MALLSALASWLGRAKAMERRFTDIRELREFVIAIFAKQPGVDSAVADPSDPAKLKITMGQWSSTADLTNIFGYVTAYPDEDADKLVQRLVSSVIEAKTDKTDAVDDSRIVAVIRSCEYINYVKERGLDVLCEPLGANLMITYMEDRPDSMSPLAPKHVPGKDLQGVRRLAYANVRQWLPKVVHDDHLQRGVLYFVQDNPMLSTSLVLIDEFWKSIAPRFPGDVLLALPRRDQLFIFDDGGPTDQAAARHLIDVTIRENFNLLSPNLYARRDGKIVLVTQ